MISEKLTEFALASKRKWDTDRAQTVGASEIGQCARRVFFVKNEDDLQVGQKRDDDYNDKWGATTRGTFFENHFWEPAMRAAFGDKLLFAGADQTTFIDSFLSATSDGLILDLPSDALKGVPGGEEFKGGCIVTDCKTVDPRTNLSTAKPEHVYQIHVQIGLVRARTNYAPEYGLISYTDASFWDEGREFAIKYDPAIYEEAQRRSTSIMTARSASELRPEGYISGGKECEHCLFHTACGVLRASAVPKAGKEIDQATRREAEILALGIKLASKRAEDEERVAAELRQRMKDLLGRIGTKKISGIVSWSAIKGRPSWDMKGLRAAAEEAGVDLSQFETTGDPSDRLTITLKSNPGSSPSSAAGQTADAEAA